MTPAPPIAMAGRRPALRVAVRRVHLWLGLSIGMLFVLAGLTGSALVFYPEIDAALHPALRAVPAGARPLHWQAVADALHRDHPDRSGAWRIEVTPAGGAIPVRYYHPRETAGRDFAPLMLWLDPVSLRTIRTDYWGGYAMTWIYDLHYRLLLDRPGGVAMGIAGIVMLLLLASGLWAWWPRSGGWTAALRFKHDAAPVRRLYDLHKLVGLWGVGLLGVVTATGILLDLPDQVRPLLGVLSPLAEHPRPTVAVRTAPGLPLDALVARAQVRMPGAALAWIETPAGPGGTVRIALARPGDPGRRFPHNDIWLDPQDGRVVAVRDMARAGAGDTLLNWLHPLHGGEAFGLAGRWLAFATGLLPTLLFGTGLIRWTTRRRRGVSRPSVPASR